MNSFQVPSAETNTAVYIPALFNGSSAASANVQMGESDLGSEEVTKDCSF